MDFREFDPNKMLRELLIEKHPRNMGINAVNMGQDTHHSTRHDTGSKMIPDMTGFGSKVKGRRRKESGRDVSEK